MKSLYKKISLVLIISFVAQITLVGFFYQEVALKRIITEINEQENMRRSIMQEALQISQRAIMRQEKPDSQLEQLSKKLNVGFSIKTIDGENVFITSSNTGGSRLESQYPIRVNGRVGNILYGYFPARIETKLNFNRAKVFIIPAIIIFILALSIVLFIYRTIANPLKKLNKVVNSINYGNTTITIPYYGEDELGNLCRSFEGMGERLKQSEMSQQQMLQAISHDVKTPLTSIIGYSKRLLKGKASEEKSKEYHEIIYRKANDLKELLEDLDDYATYNIESTYKKEAVNFQEYIEDILKDIKLEAGQQNLNLITKLNLREKTIVELDKRKIKRVMVNLVENSMKYAGENAKVIISATERDKEIEVCVQDNGVGVPEELLSNIFDRFYRIDTSRNREQGGIGLGLAICKEIIEKHEGRIGASKGTEGGLSICFTLPIKRGIK